MSWYGHGATAPFPGRTFHVNYKNGALCWVASAQTWNGPSESHPVRFSLRRKKVSPTDDRRQRRKPFEDTYQLVMWPHLSVPGSCAVKNLNEPAAHRFSQREHGLCLRFIVILRYQFIAPPSDTCPEEDLAP